MSSLPDGYSTIGPIIVADTFKNRFINFCKKKGKSMEQALKEMIGEKITEEK